MSRLLLIPLGAVSALVLSVVGCGGIDGVDALFDQGSAGAGGAPTTSSTTGDTTSTTTSSTTTTSTTTTTSSSSSASGSSTTGSSTSSASGSSSSTGGVSEILACGGTTCALGDDSACCWSKFAMPASGACVQGSPDNDGCKTFVAQDGLQTRIECQIGAQCNGGLCCAHRTFFNNQQSFFYDLVSCAGACGASDITLCDPTNAADICPKVNTQGGPVQGVCKQSGSLPTGYFVCSAP
jgi:hypothetical protein